MKVNSPWEPGFAAIVLRRKKEEKEDRIRLLHQIEEIMLAVVLVRLFFSLGIGSCLAAAMSPTLRARFIPYGRLANFGPSPKGGASLWTTLTTATVPKRSGSHTLLRLILL